MAESRKRKKEQKVVRVLGELQIDKDGNGVIVLTNLNLKKD